VYPQAADSWLSYFHFEVSLEEYARGRALLEYALNHRLIDMPEALWKALIDLEVSLGDLPAARALYRKLLDKSKHVKVWMSVARFEADDAGDLDRARAVYEEGLTWFKENAKDMKEERLMLLESWLRMEQDKGG
jgi:crooked neck